MIVRGRQDTSPVAPVSKTRFGPAQPKGRSYPEPLGAMPSIEWIHLERLTIDASYQRSVDNQASKRLIASIAAKFDWRLCAPLVVSRRPDGTMMVIDGQHRTSAARLRSDIKQLPCCIFSYSGPEEEARMFIAANRARKPMNRLDDFHAALVAGDSEALAVQQAITDAGMTVTQHTSSTAWKPGEVAFTGAVATVLRKHGATFAQLALVTLAEAFPDEVLRHGGSLFGGIVKVLSNPPDGFDPDRFAQALLTFTGDQWGDFVTGLKGGDTRSTAMRQAMLEAYTETTISLDETL